MNVADIFRPDDPKGPPGRVLRLRRNLPWILERFHGSLVEIGAGYGESTKALLEAAEKHKRRVLVVDPWKFHDGVVPHTGDGVYAYTYERFRENVGHPALLDVCRSASDSGEALLSIESARPIAFALLDGRMDTMGMLSDLTVMDACLASVVAVDDYGHRQTVIDAVNAFLASTKMKLLHDGRAHEAYLVRE